MTEPAAALLMDTVIKLFIGGLKIIFVTAVVEGFVMLIAAICHITDERKPVKDACAAVAHPVTPFTGAGILFSQLRGHKRQSFSRHLHSHNNYGTRAKPEQAR